MLSRFSAFIWRRKHMHAKNGLAPARALSDCAVVSCGGIFGFFLMQIMQVYAQGFATVYAPTLVWLMSQVGASGMRRSNSD